MAGVINDHDLRAGLTTDQYERFVHDEFKDIPNATASSTPYGAPTGTAGDVNILACGKNRFQYHILGTQTILAPTKVDAGLDIGSMDATADDGLELVIACESPANTVICDTAGGSRGTFVVGTDGPFYLEVQVAIADVSGTDDFGIGFRKAEAFQANVDDYDEAAYFNIISGDIKIETILNGAATTTTDTTQDWSDAQTKTVRITVDSDGSYSGGTGSPRKVYFQIDGAAPTTTAAHTFDNGELVIPFIFFLNDSDIANSTVIKKWESGLLR